MSDVYKIFDGIIESSKQNSGFYQKQSQSVIQWKHCVILHKLGWKVNGFQKTEDLNIDDVIIIWEKEGQKNIHIRLSWTEQCLWLEYLEHRQEEINGK